MRSGTPSSSTAPFLRLTSPPTLHSVGPMALLATVAPLLIGVVLGARHSRWLVGLAIAVAGVQAVIWLWVLTTPGGCGEVIIEHHGRRAAVLRGRTAEEFLDDVSLGDEQELMARTTGNYKRGNERDSWNHPRKC